MLSLQSFLIFGPYFWSVKEEGVIQFDCKWRSLSDLLMPFFIYEVIHKLVVEKKYFEWKCSWNTAWILQLPLEEIMKTLYLYINVCIPAHSEVPVSFNKGLRSMIQPKTLLDFPSCLQKKVHSKLGVFKMFYLVFKNTEILSISAYRDFAVRNIPPLTKLYCVCMQDFFFLVITYYSSFCTHKWKHWCLAMWKLLLFSVLPMHPADWVVCPSRQINGKMS